MRFVRKTPETPVNMHICIRLDEVLSRASNNPTSHITWVDAYFFEPKMVLTLF